eukprot:gene4067-2916_t
MNIDQSSRPRGRIEDFEDLQSRKKCTLCCAARNSLYAGGVVFGITFPCNLVMLGGRVCDTGGWRGFMNRHLFVALPFAAITFTHQWLLSESLWSKNRKSVFTINIQSTLSNIMLWCSLTAAGTLVSRKILPPRSRAYRLLLWEYTRTRRNCADKYFPTLFGRMTEDLDWYNVLWTLGIYHLLWGMAAAFLEKEAGAQYAMFYRDSAYNADSLLSFRLSPYNLLKWFIPRYGSCPRVSCYDLLLRENYCGVFRVFFLLIFLRFFFLLLSYYFFLGFSYIMSSDAQKLEVQLQRLIEDDAPPTKILNAAERLLAVQPNSVPGLQCKIVCSLMREKFGAALTLLEQLQSANPRIASTSPMFVFRKAYSHYRLRQYSEAKNVLKSAGGLIKGHIPSRHLQAQIHYNLEEYKEASQLYAAILEDKVYRDEQEKSEVITNLSAAYSACEPMKAVETIRKEDDKTYDMCYNAATALIVANAMPAAMKMLVQAEVLCFKEHSSSTIRSLQQVLDMDEADIVAKMGAINPTPSAERAFFNDVVNVWVQMAYVWQVQGDVEKASRCLQLILSLKPNSVVTSTVASTNWAAMQGHRDFFEVSRKLKLALNSNTLHRLTSKQLLSLRYNSALLHLQSGSLTNCRRELEQLRKDYPNHYLTHALSLGLIAVEHAKKKKALPVAECEALAKLVEETASRSGDKSSVTALLNTKTIMAEIFLQQGDLHRAAEYLAAGSDPLSSSPSAVSTIAAWKVQMGEAKDAIVFLQGEIEKMAPPVAAKVLRWAVHYLGTVRGFYSETAELVEALWGKLPWMHTNKEMAALRCFVLTFTDVAAARAAAASLRPEQPVSSSSYEAVMASQPARQQLEKMGYRRVVVGMDKKPGDRTRRRRKMRRPPKTMDGKIDPERWIPMNLRSYIVNLPERRKRELRRLRAIEQDRLRRAAEKRKALALEGSTSQK